MARASRPRRGPPRRPGRPRPGLPGVARGRRRPRLLAPGGRARPPPTRPRHRPPPRPGPALGGLVGLAAVPNPDRPRRPAVVAAPQRPLLNRIRTLSPPPRRSSPHEPWRAGAEVASPTSTVGQLALDLRVDTGIVQGAGDERGRVGSQPGPAGLRTGEVIALRRRDHA